MAKHRSTKACEIPDAVKRAVYARDGERCVLCDKWVPLECACCHFIPRSKLGLGVEENVFTGCDTCHSKYDNTEFRKSIRPRLRAYLKSKYPTWDEQSLYYKKYGGAV